MHAATLVGETDFDGWRAGARAPGQAAHPQNPLVSEISACRWWLDAERRLVKPKVILTLGATAALGVLNRKITVTGDRGQPMPQLDGSLVVATVYPSCLLGLPDETTRPAERRRFVEDLKLVRVLL